MIADTGKVLDATTSNQHDRVLLQIVPFPRYVAGDFHAVGQLDAGHFTQRGVGLFGGLREDAKADASLLRARFQRGAGGLVSGLLTALSY